MLKSNQLIRLRCNRVVIFDTEKQLIDTSPPRKVDAAEKELAKEKQKHNLIKEQVTIPLNKEQVMIPP